jgi:squalene-associated FAD-dependent desaturase
MKNNAIVVGAGWAGLATALTLAQKGVKVTLLEAAPQAGGRARSVFFPPDQVDNGQHLLLGAYHHTLSLLASIGVPEQSVFMRTPLRLLLKTSSTEFDFKAKNLFSPFNVILGILTSKGLLRRERMAALRFCRAIQAINFELEQDISVETLLLQYKQSPSLINQLWAPIALAALSTPIHQASAQIFLKVLKDSFRDSRQNSNYLFPILDLSQVFPKPILQFLTQQGSEIRYNQRVEKLLIDQDRCIGVQTSEGNWLGNTTVLATPPNTTAELLKVSARLSETQQQLSNLRYQPITTVYFRFKDPVNLPYPMMGVINGISQWIFDRSFANQPHLMSIVISGQGPHSQLDKISLIALLIQEIKMLYPHLNAPIASKVICEKKAAFSCDVGINQHRPSSNTSLEGLFLAGDYTQTGYPSTLEGAVQSGIHTAELVASSYSVKPSI